MPTTTTNIFDQESLDRFGQAQGGLLDFMNQWSTPRDAFNNSFIQAALAEQMGFIGQQGQAMNQNYFNNLMAGGGFAGGTATDQATASELAKNRRFTAGQGAKAQRSLLLGAVDRSSQNVLGAGSLIRPLQTGTKTKKTSSLLSKIGKGIGIGLPFALAPFTGGASLLGLAGGLAPYAGGGSGGQLPTSTTLNPPAPINFPNLAPGTYGGP